MLNEKVSPRQGSEGERSLEGMHVLVTGGTSGIGRATARLLAREGARVMIFGRDEGALNDALEELREISEHVHGTTADQSKPEEVERVFSELDQKLGGLDALINNAAVAKSSITELPTEEWVYALNTNLIGSMKCAELAIPRLRSRGGGWIVNVGSMSAKLREEGSDVYVTTKTGIRGFSDSLGKTLADDRIHVTLIEPGLVVSEMNEMDGDQQVEKQDKMEMILGEDIGRAILYVLRQPSRLSIPLMQVRPLMQKI
jgi:NADP-dependent 3-hydroxy acid dehydrogenase YdfG